MQIVINMTDDIYTELAKTGENEINLGILLALREAVRQGTPLPKGHGDLIDVNRKITVPVYDEQYEEWEEKILTVREALNRWSNEGIGIKDVVILADKEHDS